MIQIVERDPMLFDDDVIKIEPVEGDIWPNSSFEVNVVFKPREAIQYTRTAFCDITGRQSRLPLRIRGDGAGPKVWIMIPWLSYITFIVFLPLPKEKLKTVKYREQNRW